MSPKGHPLLQSRSKHLREQGRPPVISPLLFFKHWELCNEGTFHKAISPKVAPKSLGFLLPANLPAWAPTGTVQGSSPPLLDSPLLPNNCLLWRDCTEDRPNHKVCTPSSPPWGQPHLLGLWGKLGGIGTQGWEGKS